MSAYPEIKKIEEQETETENAPLYNVIIYNDDITPMDFVVHILATIFDLKGPQAAKVMLTAHHNGKSHVCTLPKPEAEKRINRAHFAAGMVGYPLHFSMEPE